MRSTPIENDERYESTFEELSTQGCLAKDNIDMYGISQHLSSGRTRPGAMMNGPYGIRRVGEHSSTLSVTSAQQWTMVLLDTECKTGYLSCSI